MLSWRIYGIKNGGNHGNQYFKLADSANPKLPSQKELADQIGVTVDQLHRYKQLLDLIPEIQELVGTEKGKLKPTVAQKILSKLSQEDQEDIIEKLGGERLSKMTQKQVEQYD